MLSNAPYQIVALPRQSLLQKLFRQTLTSNAVREVNNLLATVPVPELTREMVIGIQKKYNSDLSKEYMLNMEEF